MYLILAGVSADDATNSAEQLISQWKLPPLAKLLDLAPSEWPTAAPTAHLQPTFPSFRILLVLARALERQDPVQAARTVAWALVVWDANPGWYVKSGQVSPDVSILVDCCCHVNWRATLNEVERAPIRAQLTRIRKSLTRAAARSNCTTVTRAPTPTHVALQLGRLLDQLLVL